MIYPDNRENKRADFDLGVYNAEEGNRRSAVALNQSGYQYDQGQQDEFWNSLLDAGTMVAGGMSGSPVSSSIDPLSSYFQGKGISPTTNALGGYYEPLNSKSKAYKRLMR